MQNKKISFQLNCTQLPILVLNLACFNKLRSTTSAKLKRDEYLMLTKSSTLKNGKRGKEREKG